MATWSPSWRRARLHENQAAGEAAGAHRQEGAGRALGGRTPHPALTAGPGSGREHASHRTTHSHLDLRGPGRRDSPLSLSLLSCKMGATYTALGNEPLSVP